MNNRTRISILLILGAILFLFTPPNSDAKQTQQTRYHYLVLGSLGGQYSWGNGINNWGQVVGVSEIEGGGYRGFLWTGGKMKNLGSLDDDLISVAWSINDRGQAVGFSLGVDSERQALLWDREGTHELDTLGGTSNDALGINRHGEISGWSLTQGDITHAALWDSDGVTDLDPYQRVWSWAWSINKKGDMVGASGTSDDDFHAVLWDEEGMHELGTLGGDRSEAFSINDNGDAVGWCSLPEDLEWHACLWNRHGGVVDLGTAGGLNSEAYSISGHGQVVGVYYPGESLEVTRAFLWTRKQGMQDLNTLADLPAGTVLVTATGINDFGWITGMNSEDKAYLLIPYKGCSETKPHKDSCRR
jgi:probable HAF family extracellular repeat protein